VDWAVVDPDGVLLHITLIKMVKPTLAAVVAVLEIMCPPTDPAAPADQV
jgi:hypothetical protein